MAGGPKLGKPGLAKGDMPGGRPLEEEDDRLMELLDVDTGILLMPARGGGGKKVARVSKHARTQNSTNKTLVHVRSTHYHCH